MEDSRPPIHFKSETESFNHYQEFVLENDQLWVRRKDCHGACWHPLPFDHPKHRPVSLHVDGANLIAVNEKGQIHYRKVLDEWRENDKYGCRDITSKNHWYGRWFTLPVLGHLTRLFRPNRLQVPTGARSVKVSHRGLYNHGFEDAIGQVHHEIGGSTTTIVVLSSDGRDLHLYDPWCPDYVPVQIPVPAHFVAQKMDVSAGCIALLGFDYSSEPRLMLYTIMADFDILGWNPIHRCSYEELRTQPKARILSSKRWKEHAIPNDVTDKLTLFQTGELNDARVLRLSTTTGAITKQINETEWKSTLAPGPHGEPLTPTAPPRPRVSDWFGDGFELPQFYLGQLNAPCNYRGIPLLAYRRDNLAWAGVTGKPRITYDLIVQQSTLPAALVRLWKEQRKVNVCFHPCEGGLICRPTFTDRLFRRIKFEWFLQKK